MNSKGQDDQPKNVQVNDTLYSVIVAEHRQADTEMYLRYFLKLLTPVVILTYDVSSKESFQNLKQIYDMIPAPENGKVRLEPDESAPGPRRYLFVDANRYPVVIIGGRYSDGSPREVEKEDVKAFIGQHPECKFAGECMPMEGVNENVDEVFRFVVTVYHELRKRAKREEDIYPEVDAKPPKKKRKSCTVQ